MAAPAIRDVPDTAFLVAGFRALETERPDALFRDPLAARVAGDRGREIVAAVGPRSFIGGWTMVIRTVIIDRLITEAVAEMRYLAPEGRRLGRLFPLPRLLRILGIVRRALTPPSRRRAFDRFAGYARLEPAVDAER